jgi:hypothetical protein
VAVCLLFPLPGQIKNFLIYSFTAKLLTHYLKFPDKGSLGLVKWVILHKIRHADDLVFVNTKFFNLWHNEPNKKSWIIYRAQKWPQ